MCLYHYIYYSTCQHAELTKVTYCDTANALGLHQRDHRFSRSTSTTNIPVNCQRQLSTHHLTFSANSSSSSHSHSQQQLHYNMSTLTPSKAGIPLAWDVVSIERDNHSPQHAAYIPRSAFRDDGVHSRKNDIPNASSLLHNTNKNISIDIRSSFPVEPTHDVPYVDLIREPTKFTQQSPDFSVETTPDNHGTCARMQTGRYTIGHNSQESHSPRKSIPSHWLPKTSGPNLATAQRARVRDNKKGSQGDSPIVVKTIRETRSSVDLAKAHITEGTTFLTKETLAAVENNITSPMLGHSPTKPHHTTSKATLKSLVRSSPQQKNTFLHKMSPTRTTFLSTESASSNHTRAPSSIVSSSGGTSFHTAEGSPVRSPADSELSFGSPVKLLDRFHSSIPSAIDSKKNNTITSPNNVTASTSKARPRLSIDTAWNVFPDGGIQSATTLISATSSSGASVGPGSSPSSPLQTSRIPRVSTGNKSSSARGPTRSSILKQSKSINSLSPQMDKLQQDLQVELQRIAYPEAPATASFRHVRTVDSTGSTPILSRHHSVERTGHVNMIDYMTPADIQPVRAQYNRICTQTPEETTSAHAHLDFVPVDYIDTSQQKSRTSSASTIKIAPALEDPAQIDPAIIFSRRKLGSYGTILDEETLVSLHVFIIARADGIGSLRSNNVSDDAASVTSSQATVITHTSPIRGRSARYVPNDRKQVESERSVQSSSASELRATAPVFVPGNAQESKDQDTPIEEMMSSHLNEAPIIPGFYTLDNYGIPCLYYMYPMPYIFPQGFGAGRTKSPKKFRPRKQRSTLSSPVKLQDDGPQNDTTVSEVDGSATATGTDVELHQTSATPEQVPVHMPEPEPQRSTRRPSPDQMHAVHISESSSYAKFVEMDIHSSAEKSPVPFARQLDIITRQGAIRNANTQRNPPLHVDLTTIRNVGIPQGPRSMHSGYSPLPFRRSHRGNGLYGGRGAVGLPIHATAPFPNPVAPMGRPSQYVGYTVGGDACGHVNVGIAAEWGGGPTCHACEPGHQDVE